MLPQLSIVVIGRNEGTRLERCLTSVQNIHYPREKIEIIYVDSASTDGSPERAKTFGAKVLIVHPQRPAAAIGRNAGWQVAQAPFILFLDGDTVVHPEFVNVALQTLEEHPQVAIVWGHLRELEPQASIYQRFLELDWIYPFGILEICGGNALIRRHVLEEVGGFNPHLIAGEEPEMCQRIRAKNYTILHIDHPMVLHDLAITRWSQYWRRTMRSGHAMAEVSHLLSHTSTPLWQQASRKNFLHSLFLIALLLGGVMGSFLGYSFWPLFFSMIFLLLMSVRSAWKARWKSNNWMTLLLYGLHSQFQHIPTTVGQLSYYYCRLRGLRQGLIEYK